MNHPNTRTWSFIAAAVLISAAIILCAFTPRMTDEKSALLNVEQKDSVQPSPPPIWEAAPAKVVNGMLLRARWDNRPAFDVSETSMDLSQLFDMPVGVEDISAIDRPRFQKHTQANWLRPEDEVLGFKAGPVARAYPLAILKWHNVVNDTVYGLPVSIIFDPVSGASLAIDRRVNNLTFTFGISGKAYRMAALLYDRQMRRLWHPLSGACLTGEDRQTFTLRLMGVTRTSWGRWRQENPQTEVLSQNTGFARDYQQDPYASALIAGSDKAINYWTDPDMLLVPLPKGLGTRGKSPKKRVLGIISKNQVDAILAPDKPIETERTFQTPSLTQNGIYDDRPASRVFQVKPEQGKNLVQIECYWGAWVATYKDSYISSLN